MLNIEELRFDDNGLIPAIVVDADSGRVLTLAYMNRESLEISMREERTCFWSRSRQELWRKGETSGNVQHIVSITADCDRDALEVRVHKEGPACHLGTDSCFNDLVWQAEEACEDAAGNGDPVSRQAENGTGFCTDDLYRLLLQRKAERPEGSYTSYLFEKGLDKILKKVGEEATEVIIAGKAEDRAETVYEIADLTYHVLVLMAQLGITPEEIRQELAGRHIIDHKTKQEKMT